MKIKIEIKMDNAAFCDDQAAHEAARMLRELAQKLENQDQPEKLMGYNGNGCGTVKYIGWN